MLIFLVGLSIVEECSSHKLCLTDTGAWRFLYH